MASAIFFDRDGTLNRLVQHQEGLGEPRSLAEFKLFPFARKTIVLAGRLGFKTFVVSHQPVGIDPGDLEKMNKKLYTLGVDGVYNNTSSHIEDICKTYKIDRATSYMIGDKKNDIIEGSSCGLICMYVGEKIFPFSEYDLTFDTALDAVKFIQYKEKGTNK